MNSVKSSLDDKIANAVRHLNAGCVIAYPTEHCFGLGCDPQNESAVERLLAIKQRRAEQGVILIAASVPHVEQYVDLNKATHREAVLASWPGPNTWVVPAKTGVSTWIKGDHTGVAVRVTGNQIASRLCDAFGGAIVSTSANRHGQASLLTAQSVADVMGDELSYILDEVVGGAHSPSAIRNAMTGQQLR